MRFVYASYNSFDRAAAALEHMYAIGDVCEGELPRIECRAGRYVITLAGC